MLKSLHLKYKICRLTFVYRKKYIYKKIYQNLFSVYDGSRNISNDTEKLDFFFIIYTKVKTKNKNPSLIFFYDEYKIKPISNLTVIKMFLFINSQK